MALPAGACDAHCHLFGPEDRFPYRPDRTYDPPDKPLEAYEQLRRQLGLARAVFVQPAVYGADHAAMVEAIARGSGRYRGVGIVGDAISDAQLESLHAAGLRGARFNFVGHLGAAPEIASVRRTAARIAALGWHLVFHVDAESLRRHAEEFAAIECPFVIDHMARLDATAGVGQPGFVALLELVGNPLCWIKISGADRMVAGAADLATAIPFARALAQAAPDRTLWGTDWPHPNARFVPNEHDLIDLLVAAVPDPEQRRAILVDNPARLYDFSDEAVA